MSIEHCNNCDMNVDTDYNVDHEYECLEQEPDEMDVARDAAVDCTHETLGDAINSHMGAIQSELANIPF